MPLVAPISHDKWHGGRRLGDGGCADRELRAELVGRVAKLVPLLASNAQRSEDERQPVAENIEAIREAGLLSLMLPKRYGGLQTDIRTKLEVSRELARGCGSTAWSVSLLNVCTWFAALWPEQAQDEIWRDSPGNRVAGSLSLYGTATPVDGGYRVTGRWPFASGSGHARWSVLGTLTERAGGPPAPGLVLIPRREVAIEDTWHVVGMSGTGSNTVVSDDVFVPAPATSRWNRSRTATTARRSPGRCCTGRRSCRWPR